MLTLLNQIVNGSFLHFAFDFRINIKYTGDNPVYWILDYNANDADTIAIPG